MRGSWFAGVKLLGLMAFSLLVMFTWLTRPQTLDVESLGLAEPDLANGERIFHAASCAACHGENLGGGDELKTDFGVFRAPNISPDPATGIGGWSDADFINAMLMGVSPAGRHYYPAFPWTSYARMQPQDVVDLKAFIDTLPAVANEVADHELGFPWNIRRGIGLWKRLHLDSNPVIELPADADPLVLRGRYLVEGPGHCGECHTARDSFGGLELQRWLAGAENPDGEGRIPNITPDASGLEDWSSADLAFYFESGMDPDYDSVGGSMVKVQENLARLPEQDRLAIIAYLKAIPALPKGE